MTFHPDFFVILDYNPHIIVQRLYTEGYRVE